MKELFSPDGHLTDKALMGLVDGSLDELSRLEVGEHLSFCDACLDRYTALLTGDVLEEPETDQTLPVMRKVYKRQADAAARRYATAAAAVVIGSVLWYTGIFNTVGKLLVQSPEVLLGADSYQAQHSEVYVPEPVEERNSLSDRISKAIDDWSVRVQHTAAPIFQVPTPKMKDTSQMNNQVLEEPSV